MYYEFYQLNENPFNVTADPDFFFASQCHTDAISNLVYGIDQRKGILVVTGEVGTGKTTLCRKLLFESMNNVKFAFILNPDFSEIELLQMILRDLGANAKHQNKSDLINSLNQFLIKQSSKGNNVVLIIDEAQNLSVTQLEQIRLLSNLETEKDKLLQIVLVGQPELHEKLLLPELRQLRQRIAVHYNLDPLKKNDISDYIHHRILKAAIRHGVTSHPVFTDEAVNRIYHYTKGSPRTINILCDRALLAGYAANKRSIDETIIQHCAREVMYFEHNL
jgi:general secretion pathway protein A